MAGVDRANNDKNKARPKAEPTPGQSARTCADVLRRGAVFRITVGLHVHVIAARRPPSAAAAAAGRPRTSRHFERSFPRRRRSRPEESHSEGPTLMRG